MTTPTPDIVQTIERVCGQCLHISGHRDRPCVEGDMCGCCFRAKPLLELDDSGDKP